MFERSETVRSLPSIMLVAAHKVAPMPRDKFYKPIKVGQNLSESVDFPLSDDAGRDNISLKNDSYCELTAHYWAWKNTDCSVVGLSHYRRYFRGAQEGPNGTRILGAEESDSLMDQCDILLPAPRMYYVETIESHYANSHYGSDLDVLRKVIAENSPEFSPSLERVLRGRGMSLYNMFLMKRDSFDEYSQWLFMVLGHCEELIDNDSRTVQERRTFGYLGEILINVWVDQVKSRKTVKFRKTVHSEGENVLRKAIHLLKRKIHGPIH